jgi:hypothetical protein
MTKVIEIPGVEGNIMVYKNGARTVINNNTNLDIKVDWKPLKAHTTQEYD